MSRSFEDRGGRGPLIIKDLDLYPQPPINTYSPTLNSEEPLKFVEQHAPELRDQLPLMNAVIDVLSGQVEDVRTRIGQAVLPARP